VRDDWNELKEDVEQYDLFEDSKIITNFSASFSIYSFFDLKPTTLSLLYRASRDGFSASDFHKACDNKGPTLVIIKND
jgi:hypothetical protein